MLLDSVFLDSSTPGVQRDSLQSTDRFLGASLWHSTHQDALLPQSTLDLAAYTLCGLNPLSELLDAVSHPHTEAMCTQEMYF